MFTDNTMFAGSTNNGASFGAAINLNKGAVTDLYPELAASGTSVYVVWSDAPGTGNTEVLYRASSNNGASFNTIMNVSQVSGTSNQQTIAAVGGNVYITWIESSASNNGLYFISSSDSGSTFSNPLNLSNDSASNNPVVAGSGSYAYVAWEDDVTGNGDIYLDRGTPVTSVPTVVSETVFTVTNQSVIIYLYGSDTSRLSLTFAVVTDPSHGSLGPITSTSSNTAQVTYTPNPSYLGQDSFSFRANNGVADSSRGTVTIFVEAVPVPSGGGGGGHHLEA
jgi:hypothetical protein